MNTNATVIIVPWLVLCVVLALWAEKRKRSGVGFFFISALLSPLIAFIILLAIGPKKEPENQNTGKEWIEKPTPEIKREEVQPIERVEPVRSREIEDERKTITSHKPENIPLDDVFYITHVCENCKKELGFRRIKQGDQWQKTIQCPWCSGNARWAIWKRPDEKKT